MLHYAGAYLVDIMNDDPELKVRDLPRVIAGAGYGIVEDIGGTYGLYRLEDAFQNPTSGLIMILKRSKLCASGFGWIILI